MWYKFATLKEQMINNGSLIAAVVIIKEEENKKYVLLNEKSKNKWELPGGKVEPGETSAQAAIREIKEETNIKIKPKNLFIVDEMMPEYNDKKCNYYAYLFKDKDQVKVGSDARNLEWFDVDNLPNVMWRGKEFIKNAVEKITRKTDKDLIVFLDIDGVLNHNPKDHEKENYRNVYNLKNEIMTEKIKLLNKIVKEVNPTFVLTSYWRKFGSIYVFNKLFEDLGFESEFLCSTPFNGTEHDDRLKQIKSIVKKYKPKRYVILDDRNVTPDGKLDIKYLIHINEKTGLTEENIKEAIDILKG